MPPHAGERPPVRPRFFSGLYRNGLSARQPPALMPTAIMTRLARALAAKNLQSREIKPMINKPTAMAARAARSIFGSAIARTPFRWPELLASLRAQNELA